ncbi:helix-turn-helix domain-containing protein, partial [Jiangella endophytica]|uniref:helix-turn-helix domain-containing protein n=1 Tax=Jiangella endophytica TaxID=1623398 RepID=UPI0018E56BA1
MSELSRPATNPPMSLKAIGVSDLEEVVYRALLRDAPATARRLGESLGLEPRRVSKAVHELAAKGLVHQVSGRPSTWRPAPPDVALPALIQRSERELREASSAVGPLIDEYRRSPRERAAEELIELCVGEDAVAQRFDQLQRATREEVLMFVMPPYVRALGENDTEIELLAQGIRYRCLYHPRALRETGAPMEVGRYLSLGEEARLSTAVPIKLAISDRSLALVPISSDRDGILTACILVHPCGLLDTLVSLFELIWARAQPMVSPDPVDRSPSYLSSADQALLSLLLTGITDRIAGRELGISERTVQRRLHDVMDAAGVENRLQLGWHLASQGWL